VEPEAEPAPLTDAQRRRLAEVFGDVLPDTTGDERDGDAADPDRDAEMQADRPPHHGAR
jgi:hypothetical protein